MKRIIENTTIKKILLFVYDLITLLVCAIFSLLLIEIDQFSTLFNDYIIFSVIACVSSLLLYIIFKLYNSLWKYASISEIMRVAVSSIIVFIINSAIAIYTQSLEIKLSMRWIINFMLLQFIFALLPRFGFRLIRYIKRGNGLYIQHFKNKTINKKRVMIIGAGDAGNGLVVEMQTSDVLNMIPICFIDDDPKKLNSAIRDIYIVGDRNDIPKMTSKYDIDTIIVAVPSAKKEDVSDILNICKNTKCQIKILPGTVSLISNKNLLQNMRDVEVTDLLGRNQIQINLDEIMGYIENNTIMVTGGGGSIGSELCRQIAQHSPKQLIIFDIYENNAYEIEQELKMKCPEINLLVLIGSVRDKGKLEDVFKKYHPDIVFHAAAHKHVPLMETSPNEAIKNNVFGTLNCARLSDKYNVKKFILISTDKAVNPTNIMGATKRICEMIIQTINRESKTDYVAVRFGNVLGSNGSVIPLFKKQIASGGPVTVTHRDITRFFMTIPEAVSLVLQAGAYAKGGEIFVLDMGKPVRIYDLAVNLIKLSGYTPDVDMKIEITGLRPGEKLYEELLMDEEGLEKTQNELIYIGQPIKLDEKSLFIELDELYKAAYSETDQMKLLVSKLVPTYNYKK